AVLIAGGETCYPALLWVVGMYWIQIAADLLGADINRIALDDNLTGPYQAEAIVISLVALLAIAGGIRVGVRLVAHRPRVTPDPAPGVISLRRAVVCYGIAAVVAGALTQVANVVPGLTQPVLGFVLLKFVFLYILVAKVFELQRGYPWLILAMCYET